MPRDGPTNERIAQVLQEIAGLLEMQDANRFRVRAYRDAAQTVRSASDSIAEAALEEGTDALTDLPSIGEGIARIIRSFVRTGRSDVLERFKGEVAPEELLQKVPGVGETLAGRIVEKLDVSTLEQLEEAAYDGRLAQVKGFGRKRVRNIRVSLAGMLSTSAQRARRRAAGEKEPDQQPRVGMLLDVDQEYRQKAEAGELRRIAPKRFNPEGEAWLPILHTERQGWDFTALYSNTAQAHDLEKTHDWVVLYYERNGQEDQATVVTETRGPLEGKRVVRGREAECRQYYKDRS